MNVPNASRQFCPSWITQVWRAAASLVVLLALALTGPVWGQAAAELFDEPAAAAPTAEPTAPAGGAVTDAAPAAQPPAQMTPEERRKLVGDAFQQAKELMAQGEWAKAVERLSFGIAEAGNSVPVTLDVYFARARCYSELKQHEAAILDFERIMKREKQVPPPLLIQAQIELGKAQYALGRYDKAIKILDTAGKAAPQNVEVIFQRAQTMLRLAEQLGRDEDGYQKLTGAMALLDRAIAADPKNVAAILERSQAHLSLGNLDEAVKDLERAGELSQDKPDYVGRVGYLYLQRAMQQQAQESASRPDIAKDLELAVGAFDRYLAAMDAAASEGGAEQPPQPDAEEAPSNEPLAPGAAEPPRIAEPPGAEGASQRERTTESNPYAAQLKRESILVARATARMHLAKFVSKAEKSALYQSAMRDCEVAIATDPKVVQAHYQRAVILRLLGRWEEAIRAFTETITLAGQQDRQVQSEALLRRGIVWFHRGDYGQSLQDFTAASGGGLSDGRAQFWMGVSYAQQGDDATAIYHFTESLSENPRYVLALKNRGLAYLRVGAYERAADDFIQVIRRDPNNSQAHYLRSQALQRLGRSSEAARSLESANRVSRSTR